LLLGELEPQVADTFRIIKTEGMGPRFREDDGGVFVGTLRKFSKLKFQTAKRPHPRAAARVGLSVYLPFLRGDGAPIDAPW
jgi:hypothetical protein